MKHTMTRKLWFHIIICIAKSEQVWSTVEIIFWYSISVLNYCSFFHEKRLRNSDEKHAYCDLSLQIKGEFVTSLRFLSLSLPRSLFSVNPSTSNFPSIYSYFYLWKTIEISTVFFLWQVYKTWALNKANLWGEPFEVYSWMASLSGKIIWRIEQGYGWLGCSSFGSPNTWHKFSLDKVPEITMYYCKDKESHEIWQAMGLSLFLLPFISVPVSSSSSPFQGWVLPEGFTGPSFSSLIYTTALMHAGIDNTDTFSYLVLQ